MLVHVQSPEVWLGLEDSLPGWLQAWQQLLWESGRGTQGEREEDALRPVRQPQPQKSHAVLSATFFVVEMSHWLQLTQQSRIKPHLMTRRLSSNTQCIWQIFEYRVLQIIDINCKKLRKVWCICRIKIFILRSWLIGLWRLVESKIWWEGLAS